MPAYSEVKDNPTSTTTKYHCIYPTGTKIRDGVVPSRYPRNKWFANNISVFGQSASAS